MRLLRYAVLLACLWTTAAHGQILQQNPIVVGHASRWVTSGLLGDGGGSAGGKAGTFLTELGVTNAGIGYCQNSGPTDAAYTAFCIGFIGANLDLTLDSYGGAAALGMVVRLNGVSYSFPGAGNGNVSGPTSPFPTAGNYALWNGSDNLKDSGVFATAVQVYGAKGDGSTDDTTAFQNAINAAAAAKSCVQVPGVATSYVVAGNISLPSNTCIQGIGGYASHVLLKAGTTAPMFILAAGASQVSIKGLQIDGNKANATGGFCIQFDAGGNTTVQIEDNWIHDCANDGVSYAGSGIKINRNWIWNIGSAANGNAGGVENINGATVTGFEIDENHVWSTNGPDLACGFDNCSKGHFNNNVLWLAGQGTQVADAITAYSWTNTDISATGNTIWGGGNHGIHLGGNRVVVSSNTINGPAARCVVLQSSQGYNAGTVSVVNGSKTVGGNGTLWAGLQYPNSGYSVALTANGTTAVVNNISSNTALTLAANWTGANGTFTYTLKGPVRSTTASVTGNTCVSPALDGIQVSWYDGASIGVNTVKNAGMVGIWADTLLHFTLSGNQVSGSASAGIYVASPFYGTGTIAVTNGSAGVVGTGTVWTAVMPLCTNCVTLRVAGDNVNYVGTVTSDGSITLSTTYAGTTNPSVNYSVQLSPPSGGAITGNESDGNVGDGIDLYGSQKTLVIGNPVGGNGGWNILESSVAFGDMIHDNVFGSSTAGNLHLLNPTPTPTVASGAADCGTGPSVNGTNRAGYVHVGSGANGGQCTMTFNPAFDVGNTAICVANNATHNNPLVPIIPSNTTTIVFSGVLVAGDYLAYRCWGLQESY